MEESKACRIVIGPGTASDAQYLFVIVEGMLWARIVEEKEQR